MMQVGGELVEFCSSRLFLEFCFFKRCFTLKFFQLFSYFIILGLNVLQVALSRIEVMLVFSTIISSVVLLNYFALFVEEFALFILHFGLFLIHELATADVTSPYSLDFE